ncbi:urea ABC transporter permease subunit UrtB [Rhodobacteraceae bacterium N5(2021)]|uniref:Urea ABC transporter permease subunit UrtB n=1 Tax=Gymnodinialimonas phycosphaerae TaxID=2841589 RepID=A0A975YH69_9RHOB|nr:urea ABC transporter permease subunit UrtB [Gymnodinialimonas phycosphaerae]MBY4892465.1 urea ABC transporter permease subunit UrtB [Gymnodinialimonas phycosphaerae]
MKFIHLLVVLAALCIPGPVSAQDAPLQDLLQIHAEQISDPSRRTVGETLDALVASGHPELPGFLARWQAREVYRRDADGLFVYVEDAASDPLTLLDISSGAAIGQAGSRDVTQLRPNGGVRGVIGSALVQFQLGAADPTARLEALDTIADDPEESHLSLLQARLAIEDDPVVRARLEVVFPAVVIAFAQDDAERIAAIEALAGNVSLEARATLNQLLSTTRNVGLALPDDLNIATVLTPGSAALPEADAYDMLVEAELAPPRISRAAQRDVLAANIDEGRVGGVPVATLNTEAARDTAYAALVAEGLAEPVPSDAEVTAALASHVFYDQYREASHPVTDAARATLDGIETRVGAYRFLDLSLDGLSLASIYFLAAIGLAITFGVMGVINMAHGEFIMAGAYTGYLVQTLVPDYTLSIAIALPLAFAVTFAMGVAMERSVIRWLYHRPLETLLATFGISIALQQITRQIFGTQARPFTPPDWLAGSVAINDVISISSIRIAIFLLGLVFFVVLWLILNRTRLGLEVRAVTQNPAMAASMGINPDRINMLTFGLGSGIAGIAGVAIGLFAQVTPDMGANYIVQSFMTVVVGGVGNIFGTLVGASMIGGFQKAVEWLNPSNTLAAQTYMILFVILFIQFRPRGIIALKGRAAGD